MTMQHLHSPFTVCSVTMQHLHSIVAVCGVTMQHLLDPFTVCGTTIHPLRTLFTVCEMTMQHLLGVLHAFPPSDGGAKHAFMVHPERRLMSEGPFWLRTGEALPLRP